MTTNTKKVSKIITAQFDAWSYGPRLTPAERKASKLYVVSQAKPIEEPVDQDKVDEAFKLECIRTRIQELETELKELRSQLSVEPKVSTYKKPINLGVGNFINNLIETGLGNTEILKKVEEHYGNKNTTYACVAWYRNKVNQS